MESTRVSGDDDTREYFEQRRHEAKQLVAY